MNILEFSETFNISLAKCRKMQKAGVLRIDETMREETAAIASHLARGQSLTAAQLCDLIDNPGTVIDLGRNAGRAQAEIAALGKVQPAPKMIAACVTDAARNEPEAVEALLGWLREIIPAKPVGHSYLAVRLLLGLAPNIRKYDVPRIPRALLNCRLRPEFADWFRIEGKKSRNVTIYQRPKNWLDI